MSGFIRTIVSRGYELDARLFVGAGTFARYFEHVRWEAIRERALGLRTVFEDGRRLVIRAQELRLVQRLGAHQELTVTLDIAHVGTSSIRFAQTATRQGELIAESEAVAVVLGEDGRPTRAPDAVRSAATGRATSAIAQLGPRPSHADFCCDVYVRPSDLDTLQHVNQSRYVDLVEDVYQHALARGAYGGSATAQPVQLTLAYERETRIEPALGPERKLVAHTWRESEHAFGFALVDPVDGGAQARARIVSADEAPSPSVAPRGPRL